MSINVYRHKHTMKSQPQLRHNIILILTMIKVVMAISMEKTGTPFGEKKMVTKSLHL